MYNFLHNTYILSDNPTYKVHTSHTIPFSQQKYNPTSYIMGKLSASYIKHTYLIGYTYIFIYNKQVPYKSDCALYHYVNCYFSQYKVSRRLQYNVILANIKLPNTIRLLSSALFTHSYVQLELLPNINTVGSDRFHLAATSMLSCL